MSEFDHPPRTIVTDDDGLTAEQRDLLQHYLQALITTMDNLRVKQVELPARNATKTGARVTLLRLHE